MVFGHDTSYFNAQVRFSFSFLFSLLWDKTKLLLKSQNKPMCTRDVLLAIQSGTHITYYNGQPSQKEKDMKKSVRQNSNLAKYEKIKT